MGIFYPVSQRPPANKHPLIIQIDIVTLVVRTWRGSLLAFQHIAIGSWQKGKNDKLVEIAQLLLLGFWV